MPLNYIDYSRVLDPDLTEEELNQIKGEWKFLHFPTAKISRNSWFRDPGFKLALFDLHVRVRGKDINTRDDDQVLGLYTGPEEEAYRRRVRLGGDNYGFEDTSVKLSQAMELNGLFRSQVAELYHFGARPVLEAFYAKPEPQT